jgi:hypothetical protein
VARKLYYKVKDDGHNIITDGEWDQIARLQHWYNSEFIWTAGKLGFRLFAVFPKTDCHKDNDLLMKEIHNRYNELRYSGISEADIIRRLDTEGLTISQKGGYFSECVASGFTRVAGNEYNAYLVCEFLMKTSSIARHTKIEVRDEGEFIKTKTAVFFDGSVYVNGSEACSPDRCRHLIESRNVFSIVNPSKYDDHPCLKNNIPDFEKMDSEERKAAVKDWNWLGFGNNFDEDGNDRDGLDLNQKIINFCYLEELKKS